MITTNIQFTRGDTYIHAFGPLLDYDSSVLNLNTAQLIRLSLRAAPGCDLALQLSSQDGEIAGYGNGTGIILFQHSHTAGLTSDWYVYDIEVITSLGKYVTPQSGYLLLTPDTTFTAEPLDMPEQTYYTTKEIDALLAALKETVLGEFKNIQAEITYLDITGTIATLPINCIVLNRHIIRTTAWDTLNSFQLGSAVDPDLFITNAQANLNSPAPDVEVVSIPRIITEQTNIVATWDQGGASQGSGRLIIEYIEFT